MEPRRSAFRRRARAAMGIAAAFAWVLFVAAPLRAQGQGALPGRPATSTEDSGAPAGLDAITRRIVDLMLANHPLIQAQANLVGRMEGLPEPRGGLERINLSLDSRMAPVWNSAEDAIEFRPQFGVSVGFPIPLAAARAEVTDRRLKYLNALAEARRELETLKTTLVHELLERVRQLAHLTHQAEAKRSLTRALEDRQQQLYQLIQAGSLATIPDLGKLWEALWQLDERLAGLRAELSDLESDRLLLARETAERYGGAASANMFQLLLQVR